jgi:3-methyladenine DNA glycosylase AlkC
LQAIAQLIRKVEKTGHGFLDIQKTADDVTAAHSDGDCLRMADQLLASDLYQARSLATFILGRLAARSTDAMAFLKSRVSRDADWRVQEILAKAFDRYCSDTGYENALSTIREWLADNHPNVRRAVTEGLRIWTGRPYFRDHPETAIDLLSRLRDDQSTYVAKSVGNALRDISKKHPTLVKTELERWDISQKRILMTFRLAVKFIEKREKEKSLDGNR